MSRLEKIYYVYILASRSRNLYVGITNNLERRIWQHRNGFSDYCSRYNIHRLVYFERFSRPGAAIAREKELKGWVRRKKIALIGDGNPTWEDLSAEWGKPIQLLQPR